MSEQTKTVATTEEPKMCTLKEKIGHAIGVLGHDSMYSMWSSYMTPFLTDIVQMPAAVFAILSVVAKLFDAVNDVAMGVFADKTKSKHGRFRPWILIAGPLFAVCLALSFLIPSENMIVKIGYACVMYIVVDIVFTAVDIPFWSLPAAMTNNATERSGVVGLTTTVSGVISALIGVIVPLGLAFFGGEGEWSAYFKTAAILAVFGATMYLICFKTVKEHVVPDPKQTFSLKLGLRNIYQNKPLLLLQISNIVFLLAKILRGTFNYYYCVYNLGSIAIMATISGISTVAMFAGSAFTTAMLNKVGKKTMLFAMMGLYALASVVQFFVGYQSLMPILICNAIGTAAIGAANVCTNAMLMDTIEYGEWKTGQRNEGLVNSTRCFVIKCVMAISGVVVAAVIGMTGYVPLAEVQPQNVLDSFHFMITLFGGLLMVVAVVPMFFYNLTEKKHAEIMAELAARKAQE